MLAAMANATHKARWLGIGWALALTLAPLGGLEAAAQSIRLRVIDGDTVQVLGGGERVRLLGIDTPEVGAGARCAAEHEAAEAAKRAPRTLVQASRNIRIQRSGRKDRYGRTLANVLLDGRDLGASLIALGHARPWRGRREPWCGSADLR